MRISDWSSDVCSSDLPDARVLIAAVIDDPAGVDAGKRGRLEFDEIAGAHRDGEAAGTVIGPVMRADVDARRLGFRHIHIAGVDALGIAARVSRDAVAKLVVARGQVRSEEHTPETQSPMRLSNAVFCLNKQHSQVPTTLN